MRLAIQYVRSVIFIFTMYGRTQLDPRQIRKVVTVDINHVWQTYDQTGAITRNIYTIN